ncbi:MAG TPA: nucleoside triphosphate pyrophosphohydrolase [Methylocella sp.]|jgi:ATP diphosphatase
MQPSREISRLIEIMAALRRPDTGCNWDIAQTFETIVPFTIEEAYEVADAVARGNMPDFKEELGDLLLQIVFQARIAEERGVFDFGGVVEAITQKMIRRHPHVFAAAGDRSPEQVKSLWARIKQDEKSAKNSTLRENSGPDGANAGELASSLLDDVPLALPGLTRAVKLQTKASGAGFDWSDWRLVLEKIREETDEIEAALDDGEPAAIAEEIGDLLFAAANLARHVEADPEAAIRRANAKFERRFHFIEKALAANGKAPAEVSLQEMEALWTMAKQSEKLVTP